MILLDDGDGNLPTDGDGGQRISALTATNPPSPPALLGPIDKSGAPSDHQHVLVFGLCLAARRAAVGAHGEVEEVALEGRRARRVRGEARKHFRRSAVPRAWWIERN